MGNRGCHYPSLGPVRTSENSPAVYRWHVAPRAAFTLLELVISLLVFGIALSGLIPLVTVLSRDLQPIKHIASDGVVTYQSGSPARDGNTSGAGIDPPPAYVQHVWYVTAYDDPWVRKLGASARLTPVTAGGSPPSIFTSATSPTPSQPYVLVADDDNDALDEPYADSGGWAYDGTSATEALGGDMHRQQAKRADMPPASAHHAKWTLIVQNDGWYSIQATWPASSDQIDDAKYTVWKKTGTQDYEQVTGVNPSMNQTIPPDDVVDADERPWEDLTETPVRLAKDDVIQVLLSDIRAASTENGKYVVSDAVRLIEVRNKVRITSIERSPTGANQNSENQDVTVHAAVTVNLPQ